MEITGLTSVVVFAVLKDMIATERLFRKALDVDMQD